MSEIFRQKDPAFLAPKALRREAKYRDSFGSNSPLERKTIDTQQDEIIIMPVGDRYLVELGPQAAGPTTLDDLCWQLSARLEGLDPTKRPEDYDPRDCIKTAKVVKFFPDGEPVYGPTDPFYNRDYHVVKPGEIYSLQAVSHAKQVRQHQLNEFYVTYGGGALIITLLVGGFWIWFRSSEKEHIKPRPKPRARPAQQVPAGQAERKAGSSRPSGPESKIIGGEDTATTPSGQAEERTTSSRPRGRRVKIIGGRQVEETVFTPPEDKGPRGIDAFAAGLENRRKVEQRAAERRIVEEKRARLEQEEAAQREAEAARIQPPSGKVEQPSPEPAPPQELSLDERLSGQARLRDIQIELSDLKEDPYARTDTIGALREEGWNILQRLFPHLKDDDPLSYL